MDKFKVGDKVVCTLKERPDYFSTAGKMDYMLDRKTVLEIIRVNKVDVCVLDKNGAGEWYLNYEDIELYKEPDHQNKEFRLGQRVVYQNENGVFVGIVSAVYDEEVFEVPFATKRSTDITHLFDEDEIVETHIIAIIK